MKKQIKTLSLKKESIATLNNKTMSKVIGGNDKGGEQKTTGRAANTLETSDTGFGFTTHNGTTTFKCV